TITGGGAVLTLLCCINGCQSESALVRESSVIVVMGGSREKRDKSERNIHTFLSCLFSLIYY
ncbi:MAG: hypothetical protein ACI9EW_002520, partial [Cellvibrionaceae bacterium]